ncbi:MAG: carboxypeptidase-like regulatory domain-containing protein, partial [Deltaproteobacteria bacterium]|nr:carboxypeptidase-like regulatory domain-containing protein [Deltaproteobacteria bacterium]
MSKRITWILAAAAIIGGLAWFLWGRGDGAQTPKEEQAEASGIDRDAIVAKKLLAREQGTIDLSPSRAMGQVVQAEGGGPVAGAVVLLTPKGLEQQVPTVTPGESPQPLRARTGADGYWTIEMVPSGRYSLSAVARGYLPATRTDVTLVGGKDNTGLDLSLSRGGHEVRGTVSDIGGGPVEDVLVRVTRTDQSPFNFNRPALGAVTDEEGQFVLQLPDGLYGLATYHPDYVEAKKNLHVDGGPRSVTLEVTPAGSISGRVIVRATGAPVAGAVVTRGGERGGGMVVQGMGAGQVTTDDDGRFVLRGLGSGVTRLSAFARGYTTRQGVDVVLGVAEEVEDIELLLDEALTISGFVVARGDEERGLEGVLVGAFSVAPARLYVASSP